MTSPWLPSCLSYANERADCAGAVRVTVPFVEGATSDASTYQSEVTPVEKRRTSTVVDSPIASRAPGVVTVANGPSFTLSWKSGAAFKYASVMAGTHGSCVASAARVDPERWRAKYPTRRRDSL